MLYMSSCIWQRSIRYSTTKDGRGRGYVRFGIWTYRNVRDYTTTIFAMHNFASEQCDLTQIFSLEYAMNLALDLVVKFEWQKSSKESKWEYRTMAIDETEYTIRLSWGIDSFVLFRQYWTVSHENANATTSWLRWTTQSTKLSDIHIHGSWINQYYNQ